VAANAFIEASATYWSVGHGGSTSGKAGLLFFELLRASVDRAA